MSTGVLGLRLPYTRLVHLSNTPVFTPVQSVNLYCLYTCTVCTPVLVYTCTVQISCTVPYTCTVLYTCTVCTPVLSVYLYCTVHLYCLYVCTVCIPVLDLSSTPV